jgi:hypothetical protein
VTTPTSPRRNIGVKATAEVLVALGISATAGGMATMSIGASQRALEEIGA